MKFYFCESCGKRLTEHDIADGVARDKKLKGVFCKGCAIGVTTMESLPLSDREAKKVLEEAGAENAPPGSHQRPGRRNSAVGLPIGRRRAERADSARKPVAAETTPAYVKFAISAAVVAIATLGSLLLLKGRGSAPTAKTTQLPKAKSNARAGDAAKETTQNNQEANADIQVKTESGHAEAPVDSQPPPVADEVREPGESSSGEAVSPEPEKRSQDHPWADSKPSRQPESKKTEQPKAPSEPNDGEVARAKLRPYLKAFDLAVAAGNLTEASKVAERAKGDPALKAVAKEAESLNGIAQALIRAAETRRRALEALKDGTKRTFQTRSGSITGTVRKIEGGTIQVRVEGRINNQVIEFEKPVKLPDLTPACRARLLGEADPKTPDEWMARAIRKIALRDIAAAEKALNAAGTFPLLTHYRETLEGVRLEQRETEAKRAWEKSIVPLLAVRTFTKPKAETGLKTLEAFLAAHGKTKFVTSVADKERDLRDALLTALGPPTEITLDLGEGMKMAFVWVRPGTFMMGDPSEEKGAMAERGKPQHRVTLTKGFYLGKYEVTEAQFKRVLGRKAKARGASYGPEFPVSGVSCDRCKEFCRRLSKMTSRKTRLPTEAEWEYACRAGTRTRYHFGDDPRLLSAFGWFLENSGGKLHPVGKKKPNKLGLHDMHGNVWEHCRDKYGPYSKDAVTDPKGPSKGGDAVMRGGSFRMTAKLCRSAHRGSYKPSNSAGGAGFRVCLER